MIIVGELINTSRKEVEERVKSQDVAFIQELAREQLAAGANYIDVNAGTLVGQEPEYLVWLTETVQSAVDVPLALDSPDPEALAAALKVHKGKAMINSITGEKDRFEKVLPLVLEYQASVVALCMDDSGMPDTFARRIDISQKVIHSLTAAGVPLEDIFLDPLVTPISTSSESGMAALDAIAEIMKQFSGVHPICGLSNVSFGLPKRKLLNRAFLMLCMDRGMDGVIVDPLDKDIMAYLKSAEALLGKDEYCMNYLTAARAGALDI